MPLALADEILSKVIRYKFYLPVNKFDVLPHHSKEAF